LAAQINVTNKEIRALLIAQITSKIKNNRAYSVCVIQNHNGDKQYSNITCHYCKIKGHIVRTCRILAAVPRIPRRQFKTEQGRKTNSRSTENGIQEQDKSGYKKSGKKVLCPITKTTEIKNLTIYNQQILILEQDVRDFCDRTTDVNNSPFTWRRWVKAKH
jgi:hypothetical protein